MPHNLSPMIHVLQCVALCVAVSVAVPSEVIEQAMPDIFSPIIVSSSVPVSFSSGKVYLDTVVRSNCRYVNSSIRHYCNFIIVIACLPVMLWYSSVYIGMCEFVCI